MGMYQKERLDLILDAVRKNGFVTVKYLVANVHYSNATINRDLRLLEQKKLVKRSYGGVEAVENVGVELPFRYEKYRAEKMRLAKRAAEFVKDGDVIFIDGTTTTEYMAAYLTEKKDIRVITNNMLLAVRLAESGVSATCLGGDVAETPCMLDGAIAVETAEKYKADKMFFSVGAISKTGEIGGNEMYYTLHKTMAKNAEQCFLLVTHDKLDVKTPLVLKIPNLSCIISDFEFPKEGKAANPNVRFEKT